MNTKIIESVDTIVKVYLSQCTDKHLYSKGKLNAEYYRLRNYILAREDTFPIHDCEEYAKSLAKKNMMSFRNFIVKANEYRILKIKGREKKRLDELREKKREYSPSSLDDFYDL